MHISTFVEPYGSIAISSKLDETISTSGLLQCAAVSVVDREKNLQTLFHCFPGQDAKENRTILDYIFSLSKGSIPEITIIPGCYNSTDSTVNFLVENIRDILGKNCEITFANIVNNHTNIILENGVLGCAEYSRRLVETELNPASKIIFNSSFYNVVNGVLTRNV